MLLATYAHPVLLTLRLPAFLFLCHIHLGSGCGPGEPSVTQKLTRMHTKTAHVYKGLLSDGVKQSLVLYKTQPVVWPFKALNASDCIIMPVVVLRFVVVISDCE